LGRYETIQNYLNYKLMESPKSRQHKEKKISYRRREHKNKKFYNSKAWRDTRDSYMRHYQHYLFTHIPLGKWQGMDLDAKQVSYILSLGKLPCEICLKHYIAEAYDTVEYGIELDHITPVNNDNALESKEHGDPFEFNNLQLLCRRHHAKKSQREKR
jgi:hypothetical protein